MMMMIILTQILIKYDNDDDKYYCKDNINTNSTDQKGGLAVNEEKSDVSQIQSSSQ